MNFFKLVTIIMTLLLLIEVIVFYVWLKISIKNSIKTNKYLWGISNRKDAVDLSKNQRLFALAIFVTRMLVIFFGIMQILSIFLLSQARIT